MIELSNGLGINNLTGENVRRILVVAPINLASTQIAYEIPFRVLESPSFFWKLIPEHLMKINLVEGNDTLILHRCYQGSTLAAARFARLTGVKVIYEIDDDLLDVREETWGKRFQTGHLSQIIKMFLDEADLIKAGSPELERRLTEKSYQVVYMPYAVNKYNLMRKRSNSICRVGYFGTPHHKEDIEAIFPALETIKNIFQEKVQFEFIGCYPREWQQLDARIFPYQPDYNGFMEFMRQRSWDIGLAPLRKTFFNEAKSDSKFRDYSATGAVGIYSDLAPYRDSVVNGENGWLVDPTTEAWVDTIQLAITSDQREQMFRRAQTLLENKNSPEVIARQWVALLKNLSPI